MANKSMSSTSLMGEPQRGEKQRDEPQRSDSSVNGWRAVSHTNEVDNHNSNTGTIVDIDSIQGMCITQYIRNQRGYKSSYFFSIFVIVFLKH